MAHRIAREHGCTLASFSLDGVDIEHADDGTEIVQVRATIQIAPVHVADELPFQLDPA
jgi:hypothetical protein